MKITAIKTLLPAYGNRNRGLIKVETDEGIHGWGEAYSIGPDLSVPPLVEYVTPWFVVWSVSVIVCEDNTPFARVSVSDWSTLRSPCVDISVVAVVAVWIPSVAVIVYRPGIAGGV